MSTVAPGPVSGLLVTDVTAYTRYAHGPHCSWQPPPPAGFLLCGGSEAPGHCPILGAHYLPTVIFVGFRRSFLWSLPVCLHD